MFPPTDWTPQRPSTETPGGRLRNWRGTKDDSSRIGVARMREEKARRRVGSERVIVKVGGREKVNGR